MRDHGRAEAERGASAVAPAWVRNERAGDLPRPPEAEEGFDAKAVELLFALARRHDEAFSVVAVHSDLSARLSGRARDARAAELRSSIAGASRRSDLVLERESARYSICCPRTDAAGAALLAERLNDRTREFADGTVSTGTATFPADAFTLEALQEVAAARAAEALGVRDDRDGSGPGSGGRRPAAERRKRVFDVGIVVASAPLWLPLMGVLSLALFVSDPRAPVLFAQRRTGRGGTRFAMYKFRTMVPDAEAQKAALAHLNEREWPDFKISDDPRTTRIGRFLRRTSLDELPQLVNVLKGEMSLVGPPPDFLRARDLSLLAYGAPRCAPWFDRSLAGGGARHERFRRTSPTGSPLHRRVATARRPCAHRPHVLGGAHRKGSAMSLREDAAWPREVESRPEAVRMRVAYLTSVFPKLSESFVLDEMLELEQQGVTVDPYSLRRGRERVSHARVREIEPRLRSVRLLSSEALGAQLHFGLRSPLKLAASWLQALVSGGLSPRRLARSLFVAAVAPALALQMGRSGAQHVHAHWATHPALAAAIVSRLTGLSFSFTAHADDLFAHPSGLARKIRMASFVVTISEYNRRHLIERFGPMAARKVRVIRCGVDPDVFYPNSGPSRLGALGAWLVRGGGSEHRLEFACIARFEKKKGHFALIEACARLRDRGVPFRCRLVGEGALRSKIARRIEKAKLEGHVEIVGALPREAVIELVRESQAVVLPSTIVRGGRRDGIPVALMEAMALEVPVIATATSGVPELVQHECDGLLLQKGSPDELAAAIERFWKEPGWARDLGAAGRRRVERDFNLRRNVSQLRTLFETLSPAAKRARLRAVPGAKRERA